MREDAGRGVEEVGRTSTGRAATVEGRADDHGIPRGREREAEEVVEGRSGLGENADGAAAEDEDRPRVRGAAVVEVGRADEEVTAERRHGGAELVARGSRRRFEGRHERAGHRVEEVGGAGIVGGGIVEARAHEELRAGERQGGAEEVVVRGRRVEQREWRGHRRRREEREDEETGQSADPGSVARRLDASRRGARRPPIPWEQRACRGFLALADQVRGAVRTGVGGVDGALRQHEAVTGTEAELAIAGAEGDLAGDDPDALVVVMRVRRVVRAGVVGPLEDREAVVLEALPERGRGRGIGARPGDELEAHGRDLPVVFSPVICRGFNALAC